MRSDEVDKSELRSATATATEGTSEPLKQVVIDGVEYVPKTTIISEEARRLMTDVYGELWTEAHYDPNTQDTKAFARPLSDKMRRLNEILRFAR